MKNFSLRRNINFDNEAKEKNNYELFSLKITDSLYKKDIGKFLERTNHSRYFLYLHENNYYFSALKYSSLLILNAI